MVIGAVIVTIFKNMGGGGGKCHGMLHFGFESLRQSRFVVFFLPHAFLLFSVDDASFTI